MAYLLAAHADRVLERLRVELVRAAESPSEPRIHALRVSLKKLATLMRLVRSMAPELGRGSRAMRHLKVLFDAAGRVREAQVARGLVAALPRRVDRAHRAFDAWLIQEELRARSTVRRRLDACKPKHLERIAKKLMEANAGMTRAQELRHTARYADHQLEAARRLLACMDPVERLHEVRKHVKNAWYALRLLQARSAERARAARLDAIQRRLGDWQDLRMLLTLLARWDRGGEAGAALQREVKRKLQRIEPALLRASLKAL